MSIPQIPIPKTPRLFDKAFIAFNTNLVVQLPWLAHAFSEAQIMTKKGSSGTIIYPSVFAGKNVKGEYKNVLPNEFLGQDRGLSGFSFFDCVQNISYISPNPRVKGMIDGDMGLIFWFNVNKVLGDADEFRNWDKIIYDILQAIKKSSKGFKGEIVVTGWTKKAEEIYSGYSIRETDHPFLMHPYGGVRFNCRVRIHEDC